MKRFNFINGCSKFVVGSMLGFGMLFSAVHAEPSSESKPVASTLGQAPKTESVKVAPQNTVVASTDAKSQTAPAAQQGVAQQQAPAAQAPATQGQAAPQQNQPAAQLPAVQNENKPANDASGQGDIFFGAPDPGSQQAPITPGESH